MPRLIRAALFAAFLCSIGALASQGQDESGRLFLKNFTPRDYRGPDKIYCSLQTNSGLMFFGTEESVLEFDGTVWRSWSWLGYANWTT